MGTQRLRRGRKRKTRWAKRGEERVRINETSRLFLSSARQQSVVSACKADPTLPLWEAFLSPPSTFQRSVTASLLNFSLPPTFFQQHYKASSRRLLPASSSFLSPPFFPSCPLLSTWPISVFTHLFSTFLPYRAERSRGWQKDDDPEQRRLDWKPGDDAAHLSPPSSPSPSPTGTGGIIASLPPQPSSAPPLLLWFSKRFANNAVQRSTIAALPWSSHVSCLMSFSPKQPSLPSQLQNMHVLFNVECRPHKQVVIADQNEEKLGQKTQKCV